MHTHVSKYCRCDPGLDVAAWSHHCSRRESTLCTVALGSLVGHLSKLVGSHPLICLGSLEQIPRKGKSLPSLGLTGSDCQALTCENEINNSKDALGTGVIHDQKGPGYP